MCCAILAVCDAVILFIMNRFPKSLTSVGELQSSLFPLPRLTWYLVDQFDLGWKKGKGGREGMEGE